MTNQQRTSGRWSKVILQSGFTGGFKIEPTHLTGCKHVGTSWTSWTSIQNTKLTNNNIFETTRKLWYDLIMELLFWMAVWCCWKHAPHWVPCSPSWKAWRAAQRDWRYQLPLQGEDILGLFFCELEMIAFFQDIILNSAWTDLEDSRMQLVCFSPFSDCWSHLEKCRKRSQWSASHEDWV